MYGMGYGGYPQMGGPGYGVDTNGDGIADYRVNPGVGVDVNGDGIADYRTGATVSPGPGWGMGMPYGYQRPGVGIDVNGDGIADIRTGPMPPMYGGYGYWTHW